MKCRQQANKKGFFAKLSSGDYGLVKTFWIYTVPIWLIFTFVKLILQKMGGVSNAKSFYEVNEMAQAIYVVILLVYTAYKIPLYMGLWRSSNTFTGLKLWAILTKIIVIIGIAGIIFSIIFSLLLYKIN